MCYGLPYTPLGWCIQVFQRIFASSKILKHVEWTVYGLHLLPIMSTVCSFQILQVRVGWRWWVKETFYWTIQIHSSNIFFKTMDQFGGLQNRSSPSKPHMKTNNFRWIRKILDLRISKVFKFVQRVYKMTLLLFLRHQKF